MSLSVLELQSVPRTLLLPLWGRAELTRAGTAILSDPGAVKLVERIAGAGFDFSKLAGDLNFSNNICWLARARQFDDKIRRFLSRTPNGEVVNLGAGLDTTFARVDNGTVRWIDMDLPDVIGIRRGLIAERERSRTIAASVLDPSWMEQLAGEPAPRLFVAGGLLFYFEERQVKAFLGEMSRHFPGAELVFDAFTPDGVKKANGMLSRVGMEGAVARWGLTGAEVLESWWPNIQVVEQFQLFRGLDLRGVPFKTRIMTIANRLVKMMTIVHCRWRQDVAGSSDTRR